MRRLPALLLSLLLVACAAHDAEPARAAPEAVSPAPAITLPGVSAPHEGGVDYSCKVDSDCAVKDIGSCCGYYPACVNKDSPTFPEQVQARCAAEGLSSVCGFPDIAGCACVEGRCENIPGPAIDIKER